MKQAATTETKTIVNPTYYHLGTLYEPFKVIAAWGSSYHIGSALEYLCRHGKKPGNPAVDDLRKAVAHIQSEINRLEKTNAAEIKAEG